MTTARVRARRRELALGWLLTATMLATVAGVPSLFWARDAYGYRSGPTVEVSVTGQCETVIRRRGGSGTTCPASWSVEGRQVQGELTTHLGGELPAAGESTVQARVYGGTARTAMDRAERVWGYYGPWVLVGGLLSSLLLSRLRKRQERVLAEAPLETADLEAAEKDASAAGGGRGFRSGRGSSPPAVGDDEVDHLAQTHRLGAAQLVHTTPIGLRGAAVFVLALLLAAFVVSGVLRWLLLVVAVVSVAFVGYVVTQVRGRRQRTVFFTDGVVARAGDQLQAMRWDEVEAAWTTPGPPTAHTLRSHDGRHLVLRATDGSDAAGAQLVRSANLARLPGMRHRLSVGAQLGFGPVVVAPEGLVLPDRTVSWAQRPTVRVGAATVTAAWDGGAVSYDLGQVPWTLALTQLVAEQRRGAGGGR